jgi:S1-C subfamily serine protease
VRYFDLAIESAVRVIEVAADGPAQRAGVQAGDILIRFAEHDVDGIDSLHRVLDADHIGRRVDIGVLRRDRRLGLSIEPAELTSS